MTDEKRSEITVLPADNEGKTIGWKCYEYLGTEVYKPNATETSLTNSDDIKSGDVIWVPGLTGGYYQMTVKQDNHGELYAEDDSLVAVLKFNEDDRHSWATVGLINKRGLRKVQMLP